MAIIRTIIPLAPSRTDAIHAAHVHVVSASTCRGIQWLACTVARLSPPLEMTTADGAQARVSAGCLPQVVIPEIGHSGAGALIAGSGRNQLDLPACCPGTVFPPRVQSYPPEPGRRRSAEYSHEYHVRGLTVGNKTPRTGHFKYENTSWIRSTPHPGQEKPNRAAGYQHRH